MVRTWFPRDWFLGACLPWARKSLGQNIVVPNGNATVVGNDTTRVPSPALSNVEFQTVYGSGQFNSLTGLVGRVKSFV